MPLPLIPVAFVLGSAAAAGLYKTVRGAMHMKEAKSIGEAAQQRHRSATRRLEAKRQLTLDQAAVYGSLVQECRSTTVREFSKFLTALQKRPEMRDLRIPDDVEVAATTLSDYSAKILDPPGVLLAAGTAVGAGSAASASAVGLVGLFGTASTGTAIGGLSGVAASNAVLAWLGGGSLAAGGAGVAGGALVLGGIAVAPALLIAGFVIAAKGEKVLTQAKRYEARADRATSEVNGLCDILRQVQVRIGELKGIMGALNSRARAAVGRLNAETFDKDSADDMSNLTVALQMVTAMTEVMRTPILNQQGAITDESSKVAIKYRQYVEV